MTPTSKMLLLNLYVYVGLKEDVDRFEVIHRRLPWTCHIGVTSPVEPDIQSQPDQAAANLAVLRDIAWMARNKIDLVLDSEALSRLQASQVLIWNEVPFANGKITIDCPIEAAVATILCCIRRRIEPGRFNYLRDSYKYGLSRESIYDLLTLTHTSPEALEFAQLLSEILRLSCLLGGGTGAAGMTSLLGVTHWVKTPDVLTLQLSGAEPGEKGWANAWANVHDAGLVATGTRNGLGGSSLALIYWEGYEKGLFGSVLAPVFGDLKHGFEVTVETGTPEIIMASLRGHYLQLVGPTTRIGRAMREIRDMNTGWIHYDSNLSGWGTTGCSFLHPDDYTLTAPTVTPKDPGLAIETGGTSAKIWNEFHHGLLKPWSDLVGLKDRVQQTGGLVVEKRGSSVDMYFGEHRHPLPGSEHIYLIIEHMLRNGGVGGDIHELLGAVYNDKRLSRQLRELRASKKRLRMLNLSREKDMVLAKVKELEEELAEEEGNLRALISRDVNHYLEPLGTAITAPMKGARRFRQRAQYKFVPPISFLLIEYQDSRTADS
ncbi:MAG: hypothetical protein HY644_02475 [Acidobacteria bacterium]|nr:hypothetical protein [Acidobacteriota bacterium]